ncbi:hypothetical protein RHSIM_Rhsim01G0102500 [Rhododendron simsii]|uniref:Activator of Hsp90 ATPase AHSA1-like N-terminal domain-containing protein n=1 Tax=Rhododendron simsii TaxID=118357 RepID=A0A834LWN3_RHOSS|nr:hypothetical protein RHSIM_Rhsim01G0102500 [Rhododendron simsii]
MESTSSEKEVGAAATAASSYTYWVREVREDAAPLPLPKKLGPHDLSNHSQHPPSHLGSVWNRAGTWEEKNLNKWASDRIKELLISVGSLEFSGGRAEITEVSKCVGDYPLEKRTISLYDTGRVQFYANLVSEPLLVSWGSMAMWLRIKRTKRGGSLGVEYPVSTYGLALGSLMGCYPTTPTTVQSLVPKGLGQNKSVAQQIMLQGHVCMGLCVAAADEANDVAAFLVTVRNKKRVGYTYELTLRVKGEWLAGEEKKKVKGYVDIPEFSVGELDDLQSRNLSIGEVRSVVALVTSPQQPKALTDFEVRLNEEKDLTHQDKLKISQDLKLFLQPVREKLLQFEQELKDR